MKKQEAVICRQAEFCVELMNRLADDVFNADIEYHSIQNHTRMQNDIIRLRRELMKLSNELKKDVM